MQSFLIFNLAIWRSLAYAPLTSSRGSSHLRFSPLLKQNDRSNCPFEVTFVQQDTDAFAQFDISAVAADLASYFKASHYKVPSASLISFNAKNESGGYCMRHLVPELTNNLTKFQEARQQMLSPHIDDPRLGNLDALIYASRTSWTNAHASRLIVHMTNSAPHYYDDDGFAESHLAKPSGSGSGCATEYYSSPEQAIAALKRAGVYVAHLVHDPKYFKGEAARTWRYFNRKHGQPDYMVNLVQRDFSDLTDKLITILDKFLPAHCRQRSNGTRKLPSRTPPIVVAKDGVVFKFADGLPDSLELIVNGDELHPSPAPAAKRALEEIPYIRRQDGVVIKALKGKPEDFVFNVNGHRVSKRKLGAAPNPMNKDRVNVILDQGSDNDDFEYKVDGDVSH